MDRKTCIEWVQRCLSKQVSQTNRSVLFCDNLDGQTSKAFKNALNKCKVDLHLMPTESTHVVQEVDAGMGEMVKDKDGEIFQGGRVPFS